VKLKSRSRTTMFDLSRITDGIFLLVATVVSQLHLHAFISDYYQLYYLLLPHHSFDGIVGGKEHFTENSGMIDMQNFVHFLHKKVKH
jgi:hypothetical protein